MTENALSKTLALFPRWILFYYLLIIKKLSSDLKQDVFQCIKHLRYYPVLFMIKGLAASRKITEFYSLCCSKGKRVKLHGSSMLGDRQKFCRVVYIQSNFYRFRENFVIG